jgi:hypothetical protein
MMDRRSPTHRTGGAELWARALRRAGKFKVLWLDSLLRWGSGCADALAGSFRQVLTTHKLRGVNYFARRQTKVPAAGFSPTVLSSSPTRLTDTLISVPSTFEKSAPSR